MRVDKLKKLFSELFFNIPYLIIRVMPLIMFMKLSRLHNTLRREFLWLRLC